MGKIIILINFLIGFGVANASVVGFEGLVSQGYSSLSKLGKSDTYQGYSWSANSGDWGVADCNITKCFGDQDLIAKTGTSYGWNYNSPQSLFINFGQETDVMDAYFSGLFSNRGFFDSSTIQLFGYDSESNLISSSSILNLADSEWRLLSANLLGIHKLEIRSNRPDSFFAVDDLRINEASAADNASNETVSISEPASMALLGLSLAGIGLLGRDKKA